MTKIAWSVAHSIAGLLEPNDRDAVLGDLEEARESALRSLIEVAGLVLRQQLAIWKTWQPWLAAFGLALPGSLLLMGFSLSVSHAYQQLISPMIFAKTGLQISPGIWLFSCNILLLIGWSWTGGFLVGSLSRRTVWVSAVLSFLPCLFCLERFRVHSLSRFCLLLFLPAAIWGLRRGLQVVQIKLSSAFILATAITALTIPTWNSGGMWLPNWALSWPAWYLVAISMRPNLQSRT